MSELTQSAIHGKLFLNLLAVSIWLDDWLRNRPLFRSHGAMIYRFPGYCDEL
jgi:hypothetical protein